MQELTEEEQTAYEKLCQETDIAHRMLRVYCSPICVGTPTLCQDCRELSHKYASLLRPSMHTRVGKGNEQ